MTGLLILLAVAASAAGVVWLAGVLRRELGALRSETVTQVTAIRSETAAQIAERTGDVDRRLAAITATMDRRLGDIDTKVDRRLEDASRTSRQIHEQLGRIGETNTQMLERAKELSRLEQALRPPKARGGFGELLLGNLLADRLPADAYSLQHTFRSGERVDAVIRVDRLVPIDAKFPLDNFQRLVEAEGNEERALAQKAFERDVKGHVDAIAAKYVRPHEGTYDFAFMYLPSESVYYELVCGKDGRLLAYAHDKRVLPVSPTTFTAYLQVIVLGLKGMQIERHAHEVMAYCSQLTKDFSLFKRDFEVIGTHLGNAQGKYAEAEKRLDRFETRLDRASDADSELPAAPEAAAQLTRALDAA